MKKSLSLVVAAAMTLTTASVAFADTASTTATDLTAQQKFDALKAKGILEGYPGGSAGLDKEMTRAEFAKVLTKLSQLEENAAAAKIYKDVPATHWAVGFIGASTEAKLMNGVGANKFDPSGKVTVEQIAKVADLFAGLDPIDDAVKGKVSAWAKGYVAAAIKAGLLPELPSYQTNATRQLLVEVAYDLATDVAAVTVSSTKVVDATHIEVTFSDGGVVKKELTTALVAGVATKVTVEYQGKSYTVEVKLDVLKATEATQTGVKKVTVKFNQAVSAADKAALTYELKSGITTFPVTATYADDNKSAVLSAAYLPTGDFTLTVKGSDAISLKIEAEAAKKIDITANTLQPEANQDLGVKVYNQFGEAMTVAPQITSYNVTKSKSLPDGNTLNLQAETTPGTINPNAAALNDNILVTAVYPAAGLSINKTLKVTNGSSATSIKIDPVQPLKDSARISISQSSLILPLTLVDANGQKVKLPAGDIMPKAGENSVSYGGLVFYLSDTAIVDSLHVDSNGVVTFNTKAKAGTVYITVTNGATQASGSTSVVVNDFSKVKTFQLSYSGAIIVKGEDVVLPYTAVDTYGVAIAPKDLDLSNVKFNAFGSEIKPVKNAKGELVFSFDQTGSTTIYVYVDGVLQTNNVPVTVNAAAVYKAVSSVKNVATTYEVGASDKLDQDNIMLSDNYGRTKNVKAANFTVTSDKPNVINYDVVTHKLIAGNTAGTAKITVASNQNDGIASLTFDVTVVASSDIKSYSIDTIGTLYGKSNLAEDDGHAKAVTLVGKTAGGTTVALKTNIPTFVQSSDESVLKVTADGQSVVGRKAGKSTVAAWFNGSKVAEQEVTVSEDAPVIKTVTLDKAEYSTTIAGTPKLVIALTVKDQYGVEVANKVGQYVVADKAIATVAADGTITGVAKGSTTVTYVSSNGTQATAVVVVNAVPA